MGHVSFVPFTGLRVREERLLELGMSLPGLIDRGAAIAELPALGLLTLAGMLPDDWTCSYHPASQATEELAEKIIAERPTLVAMSALTASIGEAYAFADRLRAAGVAVVLGGLHVTACPDEAQQHATAVVVGEGEPVWHDVLRDAQLGELKPLYQATARDAIEWPLPRFELMGRVPSRFTLQTQRGCPLACEFCGASRLLGRFREKPTTHIREELAAIARYSPRPMLELADDNTFVGRRPPEELFEALADVGARYFTEADWRIGTRPEVLKGLAASGCVQVLVGIESQIFRYPGMGAKDTEWHEMLAAVEAIQGAGVVANGCFILGADGETPESIDRLVEFLAESPFAEIQLTLQTPFPGTQLYRRLAESGRILPDRDWSHYTLFDVAYQPDRMSVEELERGFARALSTVFAAEPAAKRSALRKQIWSCSPVFSKRHRS